MKWTVREGFGGRSLQSFLVKNIKYFILLTLSIVGLIIPFSNCSRVALVKDVAEVELSSSKALGQGNLPSPINTTSPFRAIFLVDQSHSMKFSGCSSDLDGVAPAVTDSGGTIFCAETEGSDSNGKRFVMIRSWLKSMELTYSHDTSLVKVAIIPFSGGFFQQNPLLKFQFLSLVEAFELLRQIEYQQHEERRDDVSQKKMGTSTPLPYLKDSESNIKLMVKAEMEDLKRKRLLDGSAFELVTITDGIFKPVSELIQKAQALAYCGSAAYADEIYYCNTLIPNYFKSALGDPSDNDPEKIAVALKGIYDLPKQYEGSSVGIRLVRTAFNASPSYNNKTTNLLGLVSDKLKIYGIQAPELVVTKSDLPFTLQGRLNDQLTYYVQNFYIVSQNSFVDEYGNLVSDSDGDGVSDSEELAKGWDPANPRSLVPGNEGKCLDAIFKNFGCEKVRPCNKDLDLDGDGLNQCEEMTLGTEDKKPDTDFDSVPDFLEIRGLGLNPKFNESSKSSAGDGLTDLQHFMAGVHTQVPFERIPEKNRIQFRLKTLGKTPRTNNVGQTVYIMNYKLDIINLPMVNTRSVSKILNQSYTTGSASGSGPVYIKDPRDAIGAQNHPAGRNQFTFLVKMATLEKPDVSYWLIQSQTLDYRGEGDSQTLDLNFELFHQMQLMKEVK